MMKFKANISICTNINVFWFGSLSLWITHRALMSMCSRRSGYYHRHVIAIVTHNEEIVSYFSVEPGRLQSDSDNSRNHLKVYFIMKTVCKKLHSVFSVETIT